MKRFYLFFACLLVGILSGHPVYAQEESEIKFTTAKLYGDKLTMWPKSTGEADTIRVDWGDGVIKKYNIKPDAKPYWSRVSNKIMGDTIRIFTKLVKLDVSDAGLTSFYTKNQPLLKLINLSKNKLTSETLDLTGAPNLKTLTLEENQLTVFDARPYTQMEMFMADGNPQLSTVLFPEGSTTLQLISLSNCDISHFYPVNLPALTALSIEEGALLELEIGECYPNLQILNVRKNYISEIDLSHSPNLGELNIGCNQLTKLDISANTKLYNLYCSDNKLTELNLQCNKGLTSITCARNQLTKLDVSMLFGLSRLDCDDNAIERLDLSKNFYLDKLHCANNQLEFLDFAGVPRINYIDCRFNSRMTSNTVNYMFETLLGRYVDTSTPNLLIEGCNAEHSNTAQMNTTDMKWKTDIKGDGTAKFTKVNISVDPSAHGKFTLSQPTEYGHKYKDITTQAVIGTPIKVTANPDSGYVYKNVVVNGRVINDTLFVIEKDATIKVNFKSTAKAQMEMGIQKGANLSFALAAEEEDTEISVDWGNGAPVTYVIGKKISRIDGKGAGEKLTIKGNLVYADFSSYVGMGLWENNFTSLKLTNNEALETLSTYMNPIKTLDISDCPNLKVLDCSYSELSELDVTSNTKLVSLVCYGNSIKNLNVSKCPQLVELNAKSNGLTAIDLSANKLIQMLDVQNNEITKVDVAHMAELSELYVANNKLTEINLTKNPELVLLNIEGNALTSLDLSKNPNLGKLHCGDNNLAALDLSNKPFLFYVNCENNSMTADALTDLYYSLNEYPVLEEPLKTYTLWVKGRKEGKINDAEGAESILAVGKGWKVNVEGDGSACTMSYVTILESENGTVALFTEDNTPVLSGTKVAKNSTLKVVATPAPGYRVAKVMANGKVVENGQFALTRSTDVLAKFEVATGVESVENASLLIGGAKGGVKVVAEAPATVSVYTVSGQQVAQQQVEGQQHIALAAGTYVVKVQCAGHSVSKVVAIF